MNEKIQSWFLETIRPRYMQSWRAVFHRESGVEQQFRWVEKGARTLRMQGVAAAAARGQGQDSSWTSASWRRTEERGSWSSAEAWTEGQR